MPILKAVFFLSLLVVTGYVIAHPGRTASDGCHYCRTNCAKWEVPKGVRHCHYAAEKDGSGRSAHNGLPEKEVSGYPRIVDGDSIQIMENKIRLHGIDAPEIRQQCKTDLESQNCGQASKNALFYLVGDSRIRCVWSQRDRYDRLLATCFKNNTNINAEMVRTGMALAYRRYSDDYDREEEIAKEAGIGLWATEFVAPWDWRKGIRSDESKDK